VTGLQREGTDVDALRTDRYLDSLLGGAGHPLDAPADVALGLELRDAVATLRRSLVRVHPSFRFEERLAARLATAAAAGRLPLASGESAPTTIPTPLWRGIGSRSPVDLDPAEPIGGPLERAAARARPLLLGGALTSAALSLAGAAFVAWRWSRPAGRADRSPMARAIRAAHAARSAAGSRQRSRRAARLVD